MQRRQWLGLLATGLAAGAIGAWFANRRLDAPVQDAATALLFAMTLPDATGTQQPLSQWKGRLLVVNFWATWCPPCVKELPAFVRLQRKYGPQGLQFVGVALDGREEVAKFVAEHGIDFPVLVGEEDVARYMQRLGNTIGALPFTVVVTRDAAILHTHQGEWPEADAARVIEAALAGD
jgi:peroxiredoxin